jgi:ribosome-binding protein aMBF1 (putative translation factor)
MSGITLRSPSAHRATCSVEFMSGVGDRIRERRLALGLSQRDIAEPGVTYAYISRIEAGTRQPSEKALRALAKKLGTTAHELESGRSTGTCPHCGRKP